VAYPPTPSAPATAKNVSAARPPVWLMVSTRGSLAGGGLDVGDALSVPSRTSAVPGASIGHLLDEADDDDGAESASEEDFAGGVSVVVVVAVAVAAVVSVLSSISVSVSDVVAGCCDDDAEQFTFTFMDRFLTGVLIFFVIIIKRDDDDDVSPKTLVCERPKARKRECSRE